MSFKPPSVSNFKLWSLQESNLAHFALQTNALPSELSDLIIVAEAGFEPATFGL